VWKGVGFQENKKKTDINVDTTSSTRNFGCILIRSNVTYLPKCTIPAISPRDNLTSGKSGEFSLQPFYFEIFLKFLFRE